MHKVVCNNPEGLLHTTDECIYGRKHDRHDIAGICTMVTIALWCSTYMYVDLHLRGSVRRLSCARMTTSMHTVTST